MTMNKTVAEATVNEIAAQTDRLMQTTFGDMQRNRLMAIYTAGYNQAVQDRAVADAAATSKPNTTVHQSPATGAP